MGMRWLLRISTIHIIVQTNMTTPYPGEPSFLLVVSSFYCPFLLHSRTDDPLCTSQTASHTSGTLDDSWIEAAIQSLSGLAVQPLDSELWGRTIGWVDLQQNAAHLDSKVVDNKLKAFFEKIDGNFRCKIPVNENGKDYCGKVLGRENRILSHARDHLDYRPFNCDGRCGKSGW